MPSQPHDPTRPASCSQAKKAKHEKGGRAPLGSLLAEREGFESTRPRSLGARGPCVSRPPSPSKAPSPPGPEGSPSRVRRRPRLSSDGCSDSTLHVFASRRASVASKPGVRLLPRFLRLGVKQFTPRLENHGCWRPSKTQLRKHVLRGKSRALLRRDPGKVPFVAAPDGHPSRPPFASFLVSAHAAHCRVHRSCLWCERGDSNLRGLEASGPEAPAFQGRLRFPG